MTSKFCSTFFLSVSLSLFGSLVAFAGQPSTKDDSHELGPILYTSWDGMCSISPQSKSAPLCLGSEYKNPQWQPHGDRIVAGSLKGLVLLNSKGHVINDVEAGDGIRPTWSPDGQYIYAINYELVSSIVRWDGSGKGKIIIPVTQEKDTALPSSATPYQKSFQMISLSPSGRQAALLNMDFTEMFIADVGEHTWSTRAMLPKGFKYVSQSVWLDEDHLLFVGKRDGSQNGLWELNLRSGAAQWRGIKGLWLRDFVTLSPDKTLVVVTATKDEEPASWNLWQYDLANSHLTQLTKDSTAEDCEPSWKQ